MGRYSCRAKQQPLSHRCLGQGGRLGGLRWLAGYVATQSGHHRLREEQARRRELDLLALPAFIATLSDDEKEQITGQVATNLFLAQTASPTGKPEAALTKESISLIGLLLDAIRKG